MHIRKIVVGMDFSDPAIAATQFLAEHFAPEAELLLVHAIDLPNPPAFARDSLPPADEVESAAQDYARTRLREVSDELHGTTTRTSIRVGKPHAILTEVAAALDADLLVVGPHGDRPRPWKPLGSTAERLVRTSTVPVLVVANPASTEPRRILAPVDDDGASETLLQSAKELATLFDAELTVLHVLTSGEYSHTTVMAEVLTSDHGAASTRVKAAAVEAGTRWLTRLVATGARQDRISVAVTFGKPGDAILATADSMAADLIVIGRRGIGATRAALLGSTVNTVLHGASCPVLVVTEANQ